MMEQTAIDIRGSGFASIFRHGRQYRREPGNDSRSRWLKRTSNRFRPASKSHARLLEWIYQHPATTKQIRRFPRLPEKEPSVPIKDFFDIPLTTTLPRQKTQWLVNGLFPEAELILITGLPGSFKSLLMEYLAAAVSQGRDFLGRTSKQTRVLILDRDNPSHIIAERRAMLNMSEGDHLRIWGNWTVEPPPGIDDPRLEEFARAHHLLIIFDSLIRFHEVDENSIKEMAAVMAKLRKLVTAGSTVIVLHHSPKGDPGRNKYRGASDIHAGVDVAFNLSVDRNTKPRTLTFECFKQRGMEEFTLTIRPDFEHGRFELVEDSTVSESDKIVKMLKTIIRAEPGLCQEDVIERSQLPQSKARKILNDGENIHWRVERPGGKTKTYYPLQDS